MKRIFDAELEARAEIAMLRDDIDEFAHAPVASLDPRDMLQATPEILGRTVSIFWSIPFDPNRL